MKSHRVVVSLTILVFTFSAVLAQAAADVGDYNQLHDQNKRERERQ